MSRVSSGVGEGRILAVRSYDAAWAGETGLSSRAAGERCEVHALLVDLEVESLHEKGPAFPCCPRWCDSTCWPGGRSIREMGTEALEAFVGEMTVSELCGRTGCSVEELLVFCTGSHRPKSKPVAAVAVKKAPRERVTSLDLMGLDERVMKLLKREGKGRGGRELADVTGAPVPKVRDALKRLVAAKCVRFTGQTRARRYWAT